MHHKTHYAEVKKIPMDRTECCQDVEEFPSHVDCFMSDICRELKHLYRQHRKYKTSKNIACLSLPKYRKEPFVPICGCRFRKPIQFIRDENIRPVRTRTIQLSYPAVRKLLLFKKDVKKLFPPERMSVLNRLIRYSLFSLYSHLANINPPEKIKPIPKWTDKEWKEHKKYLKKLSKPKKPPKVPKLPVSRMPLSSMKRYKKLAKPKIREELEKPPWILTPGAKTYTPSDRIKKMAQHKIVDDSAVIQPVPLPIQEATLKYKATKRIQEMALPREKRVGETDVKENAFTISPNALKAKPSKRIRELAEPKEYENKHIRDNPNVISPAALKAVASPRTIELAKPKGS